MESKGLDPDGLVTTLFAEYLDHLEQGEPEDLEALCARAGDLETELRRRVRICRSLRELASGPQPREASRRGSIGSFELGELIGSGGMGQVYLAVDRKLRRPVAVKILEWAGLFDSKERESILNEARSLARLDHPGIVRVYEVGETEEFGYIVMEHVPGPSLAGIVKELPSVIAGNDDSTPGAAGARAMATQLIPFSERVRCLAQIADALTYCHDRGVLHRDVKPANVLFGDDQMPKLIDFGIAHLAGDDGGLGANVTQVLVGTPAYLAPEQVETGRTGADPLSDQFSFSVLAYNLLSGKNPFHCDTRTATLSAIAQAEPPSLRIVTPGVGPDLERVIHHGLAREPDGRYETMAHLASDLRAVLGHRPVSVHDPTMGQIARLWWRKHWRLARSLAATVIALGGILSAVWINQGIQARDQIRNDLGALASGAGHSALEYADLGSNLEDLKRAAAVYDESRLRAGVLGSLGPDVFEQIRTWSERAREQLRSELADCERTNLSFQQPVAWSRVIDLERRLWPGRTDADRFRDRGRLSLTNVPTDTEVILYEQAPPVGSDPARSGYFVFQQTALTLSPSPGYYRVEALTQDGNRLLEREFLVLQEWAAPLDVELREPDEETYDLSQPVPRHEYTIDVGQPGNHGVQLVPAYRIAPRCVTRAEFTEFMTSTGRDAPDTFNFSTQATDAAWVDGDGAMAYAAWIGGRLPTLVELHGAVGRGIVDGASLEREGHGEWVSNLAPGAGLHMGCFASYEVYEQYRNGSGQVQHALISALIRSARSSAVQKRRTIANPDSNGWVGVSFRIAFSTEAAHGAAGDARAR